MAKNKKHSPGQNPLDIEQRNYSGQKVMIGLSGGINSMAVLCWLADFPAHRKPAELHLFYADFVEHSPGTLDFVLAGVEYARRKFDVVYYEQTTNSVLDFFEQSKMIPHPKVAPCTRLLKIVPMAEYCVLNGIEVDLVGYIRDETARVSKMVEKTGSLRADDVRTKNGLSKHFPIQRMDAEWCFAVCKESIGWYPVIYDLRWDAPGLTEFFASRWSELPPEDQRAIERRLGTRERVFNHNNCLPCKNARLWQLLLVAFFFPEFMARADQLSKRLKAHWGRDADDYYTTFGRPEYDATTEQPCEVCAFD